MIYLAIFIFNSLVSCLEVLFSALSRNAFKLLFFLVAIVLILFAGLRDIGFDFAAYEYIYNVVNWNNYQAMSIDLGFVYYITFLRENGFSFQTFVLTVAAISISLKFLFINKYSPYIFLSVLIYFCVNFIISDMGQLRHGLAMSIVLWAFDDIFKEKKIGFYSKILFAYFFHASAILIFPAYLFVQYFKLSWKTVLLVFVLFIGFVFIDIREGFVVIMSYIPIPIITNKMSLYLYSEEYGDSVGFNSSMVLRMFVVFLLTYFHKVGSAKVFFYDKMFKLYLLGTIYFMLFNSVAEFAIRGSTYFKILEFLILPLFIYLSNSKLEKVIFLTLILLYSAWSAYKILIDPTFSAEYVPYKSIFH